MAVATSRLLQPAAQGNVISFNEACSDVHMLHIYNPVETITVNVEVAIRPTSTAAFADVSEAMRKHMHMKTVILREAPLVLGSSQSAYLAQHVEEAHIVDLPPDLLPSDRNRKMIFGWDKELILNLMVHQLSEESPEADDCGEDEACSFREWCLPSRQLHQQWEQLIYDTEVKARLLDYAEAALHFADAGVSSSVVTWNRVVLLHGPPGTGKTSLGKAMAQKLSIRLADRFESSRLIEIDAHSLFSKYFSESGKLVSKLFAKVNDMLEGGSQLIFILIDEVESLAASREAAGSGEPADSIRAVNALLTQLDTLKGHANVMVVATTNLTKKVDAALLDRADIKAFVGLPSRHARYEILRTCLQELQRSGIIASGPLPQPYTDLEPCGSDSDQICSSLVSVAEACDGFSGRALRKLPLLAHSMSARKRRWRRGALDCLTFIKCMQASAAAEKADREAC